MRKAIITPNQIPSKRSHNGYQGSEALCEFRPRRQFATFTADFAQKTSQHANPDAIITRAICSAAQELTSSVLSPKARWLGKTFRYPETKWRKPRQG
jgi:23S rRNA U2552 (ribose-2'-O)-methylase RlmE/FtsJ